MERELNMTIGRSFQKLRQLLAGSTCDFRFRLLVRSRTLRASGKSWEAVTHDVAKVTADAARLLTHLFWNIPGWRKPLPGRRRGEGGSSFVRMRSVYRMRWKYL